MKVLFVGFAIFAVLLLAGGTYFYFNYLVPVKGMKPTGGFNVGTTAFDFEFISTLNQQPRKLNVKAWYPTYHASGELDLQQSPKTALAVAKIFKLPAFLASSDKSHSYIEAPIADTAAKYPVIIFNHGFASFPTQNTVQMQELASHGYIVLSIAHPDISLMTEYMDGSFVAHDAAHPAYVAFDGQATELDVIGVQLGEVLRNVNVDADFETYWRNVEAFSDLEIYASLKPVVAQWIEDSSQIVDLIAAGEGETLSLVMGGQMDADRIGMLGHSLGGVTATFTNYTNDHVTAAVNLDAPPIYTADMLGLDFDKSACHIMSDVIDMGGNKLDFRAVNVPALEKSTKFGCHAVFKGAAHLSFTDMNYVGVMKLVGQLGTVDQAQMGMELNHMILWYFDKMLKGVDVTYVPKQAGIVEFETFNDEGE